MHRDSNPAAQAASIAPSPVEFEDALLYLKQLLDSYQSLVPDDAAPPPWLYVMSCALQNLDKAAYAFIDAVHAARLAQSLQDPAEPALTPSAALALPAGA
jgi:hypothetical protein